MKVRLGSEQSPPGANFSNSVPCAVRIDRYRQVGALALVGKADRGPTDLDQTAVSVSRLVPGTRIDAEFLSDMGELFRVHETAVCHHRAQGR